MTADFPAFVPSAAYLVQIGFAAIGWAVVRASRPDTSAALALGLAYPVGAAIVGFLQWAAYVVGIGWSGPWLAVGVGLAAAVAAGRRLKPDTARPTASGWLVVGLAVAGLIVNGSSPLDRGDPRYQIGFRALLLSTGDGYAGELYWHDPALLHTNPTYPLLMSGTEAVTLRLVGHGNGASAARAVGWGYFVALLLLTRVAAGQPSGWAVAAVAAVPQVWLRGPAEIYADLPLGVTLLAALLWTVRAGGGLAVLLGAAVVGLKSEGIAALAALAVGLVVAGPDRRVATKRAAVLLAGGVVAFALNKLSIAQMGDLPPNENVTFGQVTLSRLLAGTDRLPVIGAAFARDLLAPAYFGLYFPLALGCLLLGRTPVATAGAIAAGLYLIALAVPFVVTHLPLDDHLSVCVSRFGCQLLPLLVPAVAGRLSLDERPVLVEDGPERGHRQPDAGQHAAE